VAHINASVLGDPEALTNGPFVSTLKLRDGVFDPAAMRAAFDRHKGAAASYPWTLDPLAMADHIRPRDAGTEPTYRQPSHPVTEAI
jgi:hypothetical protein